MIRTLLISIIYRKQFKFNCLRIKKSVCHFLLCFWNLHQILNILKKKKTALVAYVFVKLETAKHMDS